MTPVSAANRVSSTLRGGVGHWITLPRPVDELFNDALPILGKAPVVQTEDLDRGSSFTSIVDRLNLTIEPESKDLFASRLKRRHKLGTIVLPPITLALCAIAKRCAHIASRETRQQVSIVQVRSGQVFSAPTLRLDVLHVGRAIGDSTHRIGTQPTLFCNQSLQYLLLLPRRHLSPIRLSRSRNLSAPLGIGLWASGLLDVLHSANISSRAMRASRTDHSGRSRPFCLAFEIAACASSKIPSSIKFSTD